MIPTLEWSAMFDGFAAGRCIKLAASSRGCRSSLHVLEAPITGDNALMLAQDLLREVAKDRRRDDVVRAIAEALHAIEVPADELAGLMNGLARAEALQEGAR